MHARHLTVVLIAAALPAGALALGAPAAAAPARVALTTERPIRDGPKTDGRMVVDGWAVRVGVERRGQSSGRFPKPSYAFETREAGGDNRDVGLLGLPRENDWILYAAYNDPSLVRNVLATRAARRLGRYASRTRFVELTLDGRYAGVYVLMEQPKLDDRRVPGDGPLLEMVSRFQAAAKAPTFRTAASRTPISYADPDEPDARARRAVDALDRALATGAPYARHLDVDAAVDFVLLGELFGNPDAFYNSTFLTVDRRDRVVLGPVWDFDTAMGNNAWPGQFAPEGWKSAARAWPRALRADLAFAARLAARWRDVRAAGLVERLVADADAARRELRGASTRNVRRWPLAPPTADPALAPRVTHAVGVRQVQAWLRARAAWMDANLG